MSDAGPVSDEELVARVRAGDQTAYTVLFERHRDRLRARIDRRLHAPVLRKLDASDVVQEAFLGAFERIEDFAERGDGSFARWLDGIVEHKIVDAIRHHAGTARRDTAREVTRAGRRDTHAYEGGSPTPSQVAMGREFRERVQAGLAELPRDYRTVLALLQGRGLTLEEAARELGRTKEATKKLYQRAIVRLEALMGSEEGNGRRRPTR